MTAVPSIISPISSTTIVRRASRRLRWFKTTFREQALKLQMDSVVKFTIDDARLSRVFVTWLRTFETFRAQSPDLNRRDFVFFAAGLMLKELIRAEPVTASNLPADADRDLPVYFWPEGYLCTSYCLSVCLAVIEQDFDEQIDLAPSLFEIRTWQSFRENMAENTDLAIAFLDRFVGIEPNWLFPGLLSSRAGQLAGIGLEKEKPQVEGPGLGEPGQPR